jgi:hypothetical protein
MSWGENTFALFEENHQKASNLLETPSMVFKISSNFFKLVHCASGVV